MTTFFKKGLLLFAAALLILPAAIAAAEEEPVYQPKDLPVVYITIDGGQEETDRMNSSENHSYRCTGTMDILVPDGYAGELEGRYPQESVQGLRLKYIRGRGNGTWGMSKRPYKIKLENKLDLFGMGAAKTWVLLANYFDASLLRNQLTFWLGEAMGLPFTSRGVFVELVMNGEYLGNYYLCEPVQVGKNRLAIDELTEVDRDLPAIQGGYLLEFNPDDEGPNTFQTAHGQPFGNQNPSFDPADGGWRNDAQMNLIREYVQRAEDAIFAEDGNYTDYIDAQSLADYWWIMEFIINGDAFATDSAHLYKPRFEADGSEGKLHFGPLWDFDESWGNAMLETTRQGGFNNTYFLWTDELRKRPEFLALLKDRWAVMDAKLEEILREGGILDQAAAVIRDSWHRDLDRWAEARTEDNNELRRDFDGEIEHIRRWAGMRREWISQNLDRLGILNFTLTVRGEGIGERTFEMACDRNVDLYEVEDAIADGRTITGWLYEDGTPVGDFFLMDRDLTLTVQFGEGEP